jgi:hypothetical protein
MEREIVPHDGNSQQSFAALLVKPNGQIKNMGALDRIPSDPAISRHKALSVVCRRSLLEYNTPARSMEGYSVDLHIGVRLNSRTASFIQDELVALTPPAGAQLDLPLRAQPAAMANLEKGGGIAATTPGIRPYHTVKRSWVGSIGDPPR